jgi:hypothetical protein
LIQELGDFRNYSTTIREISYNEGTLEGNLDWIDSHAFPRF